MPRYTYCSSLPMKFDELELHNKQGFSIAVVHAVKCSVEYQITPDGELDFDIKNIEVRQYGPLGSAPHRAYGDPGYLERPIYDELTSQEWRDHIRDMIGWFENAMMAMHDDLLQPGPMNGDEAQYWIDKAKEAPQ